MVIYNTATRKKETFTPMREGEVKIYVCGPTVYDDAHLGHARSSIVFDLLRRVLRAHGYRVLFVKNFTDIDDKIIKKMHESGKSLQEITSHYIARYLEDMHALNVEDADIAPKATESIDEIVAFVEHLRARDIAYATDDGIYFDTTKDPEYLSLSHTHIDPSQAQSRIEGSDQKRDPKDFALWKFSKPGEPTYPAPFGAGRPGWHIECSAMIKKYLAEEGTPCQIDIHGGGADLLFPHHENEEAQSYCESGQHLARYWMHNGFVQIDGEKMSKSLGNSFFLKDALKSYPGEVLRFYLLSVHYRANFNFNEEDLIAAKKRLDKLYRLKKRVTPAKAIAPDSSFQKAILEALSDDLNISAALAALDEMATQMNEGLDKEPKNKGFKNRAAANLHWIEEVLGICMMDPFAYFQLGVSEEQKALISRKIRLRAEAKKERDFARADAIRAELEAAGIKIMDTPEGTVWEKSEA